jgi:hypothetical protein
MVVTRIVDNWAISEQTALDAEEEGEPRPRFVA